MNMKTEKSYTEFLEMVVKYDNQLGKNTDTGWKYGQVFYNVLASVRPDLTEMIRGTMHDTSHHDIIKDETYHYLASKW